MGMEQEKQGAGSGPWNKFLKQLGNLGKPTIFQQLFLMVLGGLVLAVGLIYAVVAVYVNQSERQYWRNYTTMVSQSGADTIQTLLGEINDDLIRLSRTLVFMKHTPEQVRTLLTDQVNTGTLVHEILLSDADGKVLEDIPGGTKGPVGSLVWPEILSRSGGRMEMGVHDATNPATGEKIIAVTAPVRDGAGNYRYLTGLTYPSQLPAFNLFGDFRIGNSGYSYIVDGRGVIVSHPDKNRIGEKVSANPVVQKVLAGEPGFEEVTDAQGVKMLAGYAPLRRLGWGLVVQIPVEEVSLRNAAFQAYLTAGFLFVALVSFISSWRISRRIAKPVEELAKATEGMLHGDYKPLVYLAGPAEVRQLTDAFNDMGHRLQEQRDIWEVSQFRKRLLIGVGRIIIASRNPDEMFQKVFHLLNINVRMNYAICMLFGGEKGRNRIYSFGIQEKDFCFDQTVEGQNRFKGMLERMTSGDSINVEGEFLPGYRIPADIPAILAPIYDSKQLLGFCILGGIADRESWGEDKGFFHLFSMLLNYGQQLMNLLEDLQVSMADLADRERRLQETVVKLEEANRIKSNFLSIVSHELRTPLNVINGYSELLLAQESPEPAETRFMLEKIIESEKNLTRLIDDILFFSRIGVEKTALTVEEIRLGRLLEEEAEFFRKAAEKKRLEFRVEWDPSLPSAQGDLKHIQRVLHQILENAFKFTEKGYIRVYGQHLADAGMVRLVVEDTGIGIDPAHKQVIFQSFAQVDAAHTRRFGGAGLGLAIAKELVEAMGGRIGFNSQGVGAGSTFYFDLPVWDAEETIKKMIQEFRQEEKETDDPVGIIPISAKISKNGK